MLNKQPRQEQLQLDRHNHSTNHTETIENLDHQNSNECDDNYNKSATSGSCSISLNNLESLDSSDSYIAHILAHTIRSQDTDQFISFYDKIPETFTQTRISKIKEKSRELSELKDAEFNSDCVQYNCTYFVPKHTETANTDNMQNNNLGTTLNHPNSSTTTTNATADEPPTPPPTTSTKPQSVAEASEQGSITRNESFFSEHLRNPAKNPLMLNSLNRLNKLEEQLDLLTSEEAAKITVSDASLFKANFKSKSPVKENPQFNLPLLTNSDNTTMCRDGFVTNQRYQNLKDSKHSACVLSTCYDEVFQVEDNGDEEEDTDSTESDNSQKRTQESVVINMYNDSDNDESVSRNENKEKFEKNLNNFSRSRLLSSEDPVPASLTGKSKYEKDEELLKKYENECRFGTSKADGLLSRTTTDVDDAVENDEETMQGIDYFKFRSNFIQTANSLKDGARGTSAGLLAQRMRNDFSKNDDEDEEDERDEDNATKDFLKYYNNCDSVESKKPINIQMKTLLNNKKPPPPPSASNPPPAAQITAQTKLANEVKPTPKAPEENYLLKNLVSHLQTKINNNKSQSTTSTYSTNNNKSIQFNNYKTDVDGYSNFGLSLTAASQSTRTDDSLISALNQRNNLSSLELGASASSAVLDDKKSGSSSSASSSTSEYTNKPGTINRRSAEAYMDSHGSSLTNSSKQEDEEDYEVDAENNVNSNENNLHYTIEKLSQEHVKENLKSMAGTRTGTSTLKPSEFKSSALLARSTQATTTNGTSKSSSLSYGSMNYANYGTVGASYASKSMNSSSGAFHQKYSNCAYDPFSSTLNATATESTTLLGNKRDTTAESGAAAATDFNKFGSKGALNKRNHKKNKKNSEADSNVSRIYSEHYTEDIDSLLQFIGESEPAASTSGKGQNNNSKKTVKQNQPKASVNASDASANNKVNSKAANRDKSNIESQKSTKKNTTTTNLPSQNVESPEPEEAKQPQEQQQEDLRKPYLPSSLDAFNFNDFEEDLSDQLNNMNVSGEFVTVKGRKLRNKTSKKESLLPQPSSNKAPPLQKTKQQSFNLDLKSTGKADSFDKPKAPLLTTNKPANNNNNNPVVKAKVTAQPFAAVASSNLNTKTNQVVKNSNNINLNKPTTTKTTAAADSTKPYSLEFKPSTTTISNITEPSAFPPLVSDIVKKSENSMFLSFMTKSELTKPKDQSETPSEPPVLITKQTPEEATNKTSEKPDIKENVPISNTSTKPVSQQQQRKPKFEFSQHSNSSVIFLDEIKKPTKSALQKTNNTTISTSKAPLNGIKFGFMDSSSEDSLNEANPAQDKEADTQEQETQRAHNTKGKKYMLKTTTSNSSSKSSASLSLKTSARNTTSTTSSDNDDQDNNNVQSVTQSRPQTRVKSKPKTSKNNNIQKLKSASFKNSMMIQQQAKKSSDDSSILDSSSTNNTNNKNSPLIATALPNGFPMNPNFYPEPAAKNALPPQLVGQMPPPPPGPGYFFYPPNQAAYFNAYYASVNNPNNPTNYGYPGIPNMLAPGMTPNFYQGPPPPPMPNSSQVVYVNHLENQMRQPVRSPNQPQFNETDNYVNKQKQDSTPNRDNNNNSHPSTSNSPLLPNPPEATAGSTECGKTTTGNINTTTNNQSSQSTSSSNSTTPTPSAQASQSNLTDAALPPPPQSLHPQQQQIQHQPNSSVPLPLMQINPDYYQQGPPPPGPPPYGPIHGQYAPPGQIPYPYMPPPIDYMQHNPSMPHPEGMVPIPMMPPSLSMGPHPMNNLAPKHALSPALVSPGNQSSSNETDQVNNNKQNYKSNRYQQHNYRNNTNNNYNQRNNHNNNSHNYPYYQNSNMMNLNQNNNQYLYPTPQQLAQQHMPPPLPPQQQQHPDNQFIGHRMPYTGPGNIHPHHYQHVAPPGQQLPIIADALHVAYADYRGDFNLDEAANHTANQWNNMKEAMNNRTY